MRHPIVILIFLSFITCHLSRAQNSYIVGFRAHYGFIIPHAVDLKPVSKTRPRGFELEWNWQLMSKNAWNYCYCYPRTGVSFFFIDYHNPDILGHAYATYFFIEPVINAEKKLNISFRFGMGPSFMDRVYDEQSNPENTFYSSRLSFIVLLKTTINYRINNSLGLQMAANYNHISNGGIKNPNRGINFPTFNLGIDYYLRPQPYTIRLKNDTIDLNPKKNRFEVAVFGTGKTDIKGHTHYPVYGIYGNYTRVVGRLSGISAGIELTNDLADKHEIERLQITSDSSNVDHKYAAILAGHDLLIGRFVFKIQIGAYIYSPFKREDPVYQRYGLNFHITDELYTGINIKAHRHIADFLDIRLGYTF
ncbi:MAG: acyloxyacyl hydrolase [Bacteroidales bacterium]|nr:acyloxyacyl hydrolase [Bacteroidales bacterium]